jgi:Prismane/CO dehydrogenase family
MTGISALACRFTWRIPRIAQACFAFLSMHDASLQRPPSFFISLSDPAHRPPARLQRPWGPTCAGCPDSRCDTSAAQTGVSGVRHLAPKQFGDAVARALELPGFAEDGPPGRALTVGFGHKAVLGVAPQVVDAVKAGKLEHIFLIGGCGGLRRNAWGGGVWVPFMGVWRDDGECRLQPMALVLHQEVHH